MAKRKGPDRRPITKAELMSLAAACGLSTKKWPTNFGRHAPLIARLIFAEERRILDRAAKDAAELSAVIDGQTATLVGWFSVTSDDRFFLIPGVADPREVHDNGKPYYRAYAVPAQKPKRRRAMLKAAGVPNG